MNTDQYQSFLHTIAYCYAHKDHENQYHHTIFLETQQLLIHEAEIELFTKQLTNKPRECKCQTLLPPGKTFDIITQREIKNHDTLGPFPRGTARFVHLVTKAKQEKQRPHRLLSEREIWESDLEIF
jgi:hypothetical protein